MLSAKLAEPHPKLVLAPRNPHLGLVRAGCKFCTNRRGATLRRATDEPLAYSITRGNLSYEPTVSQQFAGDSRVGFQIDLVMLDSHAEPTTLNTAACCCSKLNGRRSRSWKFRRSSSGSTILTGLPDLSFAPAANKVAVT